MNVARGVVGPRAIRVKGVTVSSSATNATFPRPLRPKERDLLESVLPGDRAGYRRYRELLTTMVVLGEGRRGPGNLLLGYPGTEPDIGAPFEAVVAYGIVETTKETFTITVRECVERQVDVEIVSTRNSIIPDHFEEKRRWTYSTWSPGEPSPPTGLPVREVRIDEHVTLAVGKQENRLWLHDAKTGVNYLLPITNYYNELMLLKRIRDPKIALRSSLLFTDLDSYSDADLRGACVAYNRLRPRVELNVGGPLPRLAGFRSLLRRFLVKAS
jgi:hypothetical protein